MRRRGLARVIGIIPDQIITKTLLLSPRVVDGKVDSDMGLDILKMAVVERHRATGNVASAWCRALASLEALWLPQWLTTRTISLSPAPQMMICWPRSWR